VLGVVVCDLEFGQDFDIGRSEVLAVLRLQVEGKVSLGQSLYLRDCHLDLLVKRRKVQRLLLKDEFEVVWFLYNACKVTKDCDFNVTSTTQLVNLPRYRSLNTHLFFHLDAYCIGQILSKI
jgi:hypothetical protein